jgi:two-component system CheB/CheR fusion protein
MVEPLPDREGESLFVLAFHEVGQVPKSTVVTGIAGETSDASDEPSNEELLATRERLRNVSEELEAANEELQSSNEEYLSINEELQSTNEELETSKEELQSLNEELETINVELSSRNDTLVRANSDLANCSTAPRLRPCSWTTISTCARGMRGDQSATSSLT